MVLDELVQVIEDFTLPFGEREHFIPPVRPGWADYNANRRRKSTWDLGFGFWDLGFALRDLHSKHDRTNRLGLRRGSRLGDGRSRRDFKAAGRSVLAKSRADRRPGGQYPEAGHQADVRE